MYRPIATTASSLSVVTMSVPFSSYNELFAESRKFFLLYQRVFRALVRGDLAGSSLKSPTPENKDLYRITQR